MRGLNGIVILVALSTAQLLLNCDPAHAQTTEPGRTLLTRQLGPDSTLRIIAKPISAAVKGALGSSAHDAPLYVISAVIEADDVPPQTIWTHFYTGDVAELQCLDAKIAYGSLIVAMYGGISVMLYRQPLASELLAMQTEPVVAQLSSSMWGLTARLSPEVGKRYRVPGVVEAKLSVEESGGWIIDVINRVGKAAASTRFVQVGSLWKFQATGTKNE